MPEIFKDTHTLHRLLQIRSFHAQGISQQNNDNTETTRAVHDAKSDSTRFNMAIWRQCGPLRLSAGMRPYAVQVIEIRPRIEKRLAAPILEVVVNYPYRGKLNEDFCIYIIHSYTYITTVSRSYVRIDSYKVVWSYSVYHLCNLLSDNLTAKSIHIHRQIV